jgi:hypothetical protein
VKTIRISSKRGFVFWPLLFSFFFWHGNFITPITDNSSGERLTQFFIRHRQKQKRIV